MFISSQNYSYVTVSKGVVERVAFPVKPISLPITQEEIEKTVSDRQADHFCGTSWRDYIKEKMKASEEVLKYHPFKASKS